jgi:Rrf2 family protein
MKINKSIEQGIFVVIMLELEKDHKPLKCPTLSENLGVSTTYLQKILHRMVSAGIVSSNASKDGGYTIAKPANKITIADIMDAVDETIFDFDSKRLAKNLFGNDPHVAKAELKVSDCIGSGLAAMHSKFAAVTIEDLLEKDRDKNGSIKWESRIK